MTHQCRWSLKGVARAAGALAILVAIALPGSVATAADTVNVAVYPGSMVSMSVYVAVQKGFFTKHNLVGNIVNIAAGPQHTAALLAGSIHFGQNTLDNVLLASATGAPVKIVVGNTVRPIFALQAHPSYPLPSRSQGYPAVMRDLKGAKIGVTGRGTTTERIVMALLRDAGLDPVRDVTFVATGAGPTALAAMQNRQVDVTLAFEPNITLLAARGFITLVDLQKGEGARIIPGVKVRGFNAYYGTDAYVKANEDVVRRFNQALTEADAWAHDGKNFEELKSVLREYMKVDEPLLGPMIQSALPSNGADFDPAAIDAWNAFTLSFKLIQRPLTKQEMLWRGLLAGGG